METDEEREDAKRQFAILNAEIEARQTRMNGERAQLRERELREGTEMRAAATHAGTVPGKATHSCKGKKYKLQKIPKGRKGF